VSDEGGSMLPMVAGLVMATLVIIVLALDISLYSAAVREVAFAADAGAEAGASRIDVAARYEGSLVIDAGAARAAAEIAARDARPRDDRKIVVETEPTRVCVIVSQPFTAHLVAVRSTIAVTACAIPMEG